MLTNKSLFTFENKIKSKKIDGCFRPKTLFHFITYHHNFVFRLKLLKWSALPSTKPVITEAFGGVETFLFSRKIDSYTDLEPMLNVVPHLSSDGEAIVKLRPSPATQSKDHPQASRGPQTLGAGPGLRHSLGHSSADWVAQGTSLEKRVPP